MTAGWRAFRVELELPPDDALMDLVSGAAMELDAQGVEVRDEDDPPVLLISFGPESKVLGSDVREALEELGVQIQDLVEEVVPDVDWSSHWKSHFTPMAFGPLWVVPSWLEPPAHAEHVLRIDPSMAFGTGLHATTALCLDRIVELSPVGSVLDVGTGTGILAMGALRLGSQHVVGTDNDPDALAVARENAALNGLEDRLVLSGDPLERIPGRFDLVVANILAEPLIEMAPALTARVAPGGRALLSGVLATQADRVAAAYVAAGLKAPAVAPREEWVRIELEA